METIYNEMALPRPDHEEKLQAGYLVYEWPGTDRLATEDEWNMMYIPREFCKRMKRRDAPEDGRNSQRKIVVRNDAERET